MVKKEGYRTKKTREEERWRQREREEYVERGGGDQCNGRKNLRGMMIHTLMMRRSGR
jgi:hypothetical protein